MPQYMGKGRQMGGSDPIGTGGSDPIGTGGGLSDPIGTGGGLSDPIGTGGGVSDPIGTGGGLSDPIGTGGGGLLKTSLTAATALGPTVIAQRRLNFKIQHQQQSEWCWAAVAASVQQFFVQDPNPTRRMTQCAVANMVLPGNPKCCDGPEDCNKPAKLEDALTKIHKWRNTLEVALTFEEVQREIDRGRPVCAQITWNSGGGHFVVVGGYRVLASGAQQLYIADPLNPSNLVDFDEFSVAYYGEGVWTETDLVVDDWL
jgi:hypothetical protein